jgi:hypothetical protein
MTAAATLIAEKRCCGGCLLAVTKPEKCRCRCRNGLRLHGLLAGADVSILLDLRAHGMHRLDDLEILMSA